MNYDNPQLPYYLALDTFPKFGPVRSRKLQSAFPEPIQAWRATLHELVMAGIEPRIAEEFLSFRPTIAPEKLVDGLAQEQISVVFSFERNYPSNLLQIFDPPFLLYYKGDLTNISHPSAVVGSRKFSRYGQEITSTLVRDLARAGLVIISGLALGIDSLAHQAALGANGRTWAVLGSGLDRRHIYPSSNRYIADQIIAHDGALLAEFRPGTIGLPHHFPLRNRIIAGLSFATLVIEAAMKSGSLITAQLALDYGREVLAVPGPITSPWSTGTNHLIKQGARAVTEAADILDLLDLKSLTSYSNNTLYSPESQEEALLLSFLSHEALHVDDLVRLSGQPVNEIQSRILLLEMKGAVKNLGNMEYIKL